MGRVIVFRPEDERMPYPDEWYNNAAVIVQEMGPPFSIHDPEKIREYYRRLFEGTADKEELRKAIAARSFARTAEQYRLIANAGARVVVPYDGQRALYDRVAKQLREHGVTGAILREAAPITVTCFSKNLKEFAEPVPFAGHGKEQTEDSGIYVLRPQHEALYDPLLGLHLPQEERSDYIF